MKNWKILGVLIMGLIFVVQACDDDDVKPDPPNLPSQEIQVKINHTFGGQTLELNKEQYVTGNDDTISVTRLIYHINKFKFTGTDGTVERPDLYFMVDADDANSLTLQFDSLEGKSFSKVEFNIGVMDSVDNYDGILNDKFTDPMYWGMINGYINVKLEGRSSSVTADSTYLHHVGGYTGDYKLARTISIDFGTSVLQSRPGKNILTIDMDLAQYFSSVNTIDLSQINRLHKPNDEAKLIADNWPAMFSFGGIK